MRCKRMPQRMRRNLLADTGSVYVFVNYTSYGIVCKPAAAFIQKQCRLIFPCSARSLIQIFFYSTQCPIAYRQKTLLFTLAFYLNHASYKIYVLDIQTN